MAIAAIAVAAAACSREGPLSGTISAQDISALSYAAPEGAYSGDYFLFPLDDTVVRLAGRHHHATLRTAFGSAAAGGSQRVGVGDRLEISIWEAGKSGLFSKGESTNSKIDAVVDEDGMIFVPFVGRVRAAGSSLEAVRTTLQIGLQDKAIEPQVLVRIDDAQANTATVIGDVKTPGRYSISPAGTKVLDLIAEAGGANSPSYETSVRLSRNGRAASALLEDVFEERSNNIQLADGDRLLVVHEPRSFTAFGAVVNSEAIKFGGPELTLAEAIGRAEGLSDNRADASGIFLFRFEDATLVRKLKPEVDIRGYTHVPVVYQLSLEEAKGFFHARRFLMRDKDILYVANSLTAEIGKFLDLLQPVLSSATTISRLTD